MKNVCFNIAIKTLRELQGVTFSICSLIVFNSYFQ